MKKKIMMIVVIVYVVASVLMIASMDKKVKRLEKEKLELSGSVINRGSPDVGEIISEEEEKTFRHNLWKLNLYFHLLDGIPNKSVHVLISYGIPCKCGSYIDMETLVKWTEEGVPYSIAEYCFLEKRAGRMPSSWIVSIREGEKTSDNERSIIVEMDDGNCYRLGFFGYVYELEME